MLLTLDTRVNAQGNMARNPRLEIIYTLDTRVNAQGDRKVMIMS